MPLKAKEPAGGRFAPLGYICKDPVLVDAAVLTNRQLLRINVIVFCPSRKATAILSQQEYMEVLGKRKKLGIGDSFGKVTLKLLQEESFIEVFKALEAGQVVKHQNGHRTKQPFCLPQAGLSSRQVAGG